MNANSAHGIRATVAAHTPQQAPGHGGAGPAHRPGDQVTHYKGATLRTSFAMVRPGGMSKAMLAKLKPRPAPPGGAGVARAQGESLDDALERGSGKHRAADGSSGEEAPRHARVNRRDGEGGGQPGSSDDDGDAPGDEDEGAPAIGRRKRPAARVALKPAPAVRSGSSTLRAEWAVAAFAAGGAPALEQALATRLFQAARGPGTLGWRKPWLGQVGACHAAAKFDGGGQGMAGVRELLVPLSAAASDHRLLPNPMRATFFCLLPLVLLDLQRPRTPRQRQDLLVRLAVLARQPAPRRPF